MLDCSLVLMPILIFKWLSRAVGLTFFLFFFWSLFSHRLKRNPLRKLHQMSSKLMCLSCLKTVHFRKFWVGRLICALWQVNDYPTVSVILPSFYFGSSYLCGRNLDTRHYRKINPLSCTQLSPQEAFLRGTALLFFGDRIYFFSNFWIYLFIKHFKKTKCLIAKTNEHWTLEKDQ